MVSIFNLIQCMVVFTLLICCQIQATPIDNNYNEMNDLDFVDTVSELLPSQQDQFYHEQFRRASLRYHPHILYKKASLKPIIGYNGKMTFSERDRY